MPHQQEALIHHLLCGVDFSESPALSCHFLEVGNIRHPSFNFFCQALPGEVGLQEHSSRSRRFHGPGIHFLMIVRRLGKRDQDSDLSIC